MRLTEPERKAIATRVAALEARTGAQLVTAVVAKSDSYPEAPWKAFALGAGVSALACVAWQFLADGWSGEPSGIVHVAVILASGALLALLAVLFPPIARRFVDPLRREVEAGQFAHSLFSRHRLDRTRGRLGILLLVSHFERKVVIVADAGFDGRVDPADWHHVTRRTAILLKHAGTAIALRAGLDALEAMLLERGFSGGEGGNERSDAVVELESAS